MSTSTARDADRAPDGLGVHWVRTFRQACRVAADRAYGFSVFRRSAPGLARAVWPWLWPVQMVGAGRQGSGIVVSGGASLALTGEPDQRPVWSAFMVGLFAYFVEIALIITPAVFGLTLAGLPGGDPDLAFALGWSLALGWRPLLHDPPIPQHSDGVGQRQRLLLVVRDEHRRDALGAEQRMHLVAYMTAHRRVQR